MDPKTVRYTKEHEWVGLDGLEAVVGITAHAQEALGDITFVELPAVGKTLKAGDVLGVVESVKAASDIFAPVAGTVAAINPALAAKPELLNQSPYEAGWLCRLKGVDAKSLSSLMNAGQYEAFCAAAH